MRTKESNSSSCDIFTPRTDARMPLKLRREIWLLIRAFSGETTMTIAVTVDISTSRKLSFINNIYLANSSPGRRRNISNFPYPVGRTQMTSRFKYSCSKHITCFSFKIVLKYALLWIANSKHHRKRIYSNMMSVMSHSCDN